jgi:6-phosphogluconolactonase
MPSTDSPEPTEQTLVSPETAGLAEEASELFLSHIEQALAERGRAVVVLAGGTTPASSYRALARLLLSRPLALDRITWLFGDERWVGPGQPESNEGMARASLLGPIGAQEERILSWNAAVGQPVDCARAYAMRIESLGDQQARRPDLAILGIGADGHTASLFPGAWAYQSMGDRREVNARLSGTAAAIFVQKNGTWRLTLCPDYLRTSRCVAFLASGAEKAKAVLRARQGDPATPAAWIRGALTLFLVTRDAMGPERPEFGGNVGHA